MRLSVIKVIYNSRFLSHNAWILVNLCVCMGGVIWDGWRCWWTDFVPEAIHNPVAIKLLVSGLLT